MPLAAAQLACAAGRLDTVTTSPQVPEQLREYTAFTVVTVPSLRLAVISGSSLLTARHKLT